MIICKSKEEIEIMRQSCLLVGKAHAAVVSLLKPGITTQQVNDWVEEFILDQIGRAHV